MYVQELCLWLKSLSYEPEGGIMRTWPKFEFILFEVDNRTYLVYWQDLLFVKVTITAMLRSLTNRNFRVLFRFNFLVLIWVSYYNMTSLVHFGSTDRQKNGILLPKLFWARVRKKCSNDREKLLKFEAEGWEFWDH